MYNILSEVEVKSQEYKAGRQTRKYLEVRATMNKLRLGEGFEVKRADGLISSKSIGSILGNMNKKMNGIKLFSYRTKIDESGWVIYRKK